MATKLRSATGGFISLFHHRWSVPIIAELHQSGGTKFISLIHKLTLSRDSLSRTLKSLAVQKWVTRNPGYGHPMRPEYILTENGRAIGPFCFDLAEKISELRLEEPALKKWSMPLLFAICSSIHRFSDLREAYPEITPKALTEALKEMASAELIHRVVLDTYPPSVEYHILKKGLRFCPILSDLVSALDEVEKNE
jgi:DNA-binding HxlR family transcriptional regulator